MSEQHGQDKGMFGTTRGMVLGLIALGGFFYAGSSLMWGYWGRAAIGLGAMVAAVLAATYLNRRPGPPDGPQAL